MISRREQSCFPLGLNTEKTINIAGLLSTQLRPWQLISSKKTKIQNLNYFFAGDYPPQSNEKISFTRKQKDIAVPNFASRNFFCIIEKMSSILMCV